MEAAWGWLAGRMGVAVGRNPLPSRWLAGGLWVACGGFDGERSARGAFRLSRNANPCCVFNLCVFASSLFKCGTQGYPFSAAANRLEVSSNCSGGGF